MKSEVFDTGSFAKPSHEMLSGFYRLSAVISAVFPHEYIGGLFKFSVVPQPPQALIEVICHREPGIFHGSVSGFPRLFRGLLIFMFSTCNGSNTQMECREKQE
jgi:hypothetical protein